MKKLFLILLIVIISSDSYSQNDCNIINEYKKIFKIEKFKYGKKEVLIKKVDKIEANSCFSDLINNNQKYIGYLFTHFSGNLDYKSLLAINDSGKFQDVFIEGLKNNKAFNNVMSKLTNKTIKKSSFIPDTISVDELLNIAVKYFSVTKIDNKERYHGKVCAGVNGIKQTEKVRRPQVEAFCFSSILNSYKGKSFNMYNEFVNGIKELYKINLGIDNKEKLLRAQGAMYVFMRNNKKLKELLLHEYENKKEYLPFILKI